MQRTPFLQMKPSLAPDVSTTAAEKPYLGLKYRVMQSRAKSPSSDGIAFSAPEKNLLEP